MTKNAITARKEGLPSLGLGDISPVELKAIASDVAEQQRAEQKLAVQKEKSDRAAEKEFNQYIREHAELEGYRILQDSIRSHVIKPLLTEAIKDGRSSITVQLRNHRDSGYRLFDRDNRPFATRMHQRERGSSKPIIPSVMRELNRQLRRHPVLTRADFIISSDDDKHPLKWESQYRGKTLYDLEHIEISFRNPNNTVGFAVSSALLNLRLATAKVSKSLRNRAQKLKPRMKSKYDFINEFKKAAQGFIDSAQDLKQEAAALGLGFFIDADSFADLFTRQIELIENRGYRRSSKTEKLFRLSLIDFKAAFLEASELRELNQNYLDDLKERCEKMYGEIRANISKEEAQYKLQTLLGLDAGFEQLETYKKAESLDF